MPVLFQINQISKAYGAAVILENATASLASDQKIGMIGRNGAGKSTLCRIITGHESADGGSIIRNSGLRLSYLEQHDDFKPGETIVDFLVRKTHAEPWQCGQMAAQFHIKGKQLDLPVESLAGGYRMRVKLTGMLLNDPNFLLLDEPSNFLDLRTMILLENFLNGFRGGYLIVSHDREFLKRTCDHTLELEGGELTLYPGDIEEYFEFKEEQTAQKEAYNRGVAKKREQLQAFVDRFRAKASTASRAQSKLKQLQKLKTIEIGHPSSTVRIRIPRVEPKAGIAFTCEKFTIGYPEKDVARNIHFEIERGKHVAVLGDNGEGKTTLLKTMAGEIAAKSGTFRWGSGLKVAYYAQHVFSSLNPEDTVYSHLLRESAEEVTSQDVLNMAGCFLFKGDDVKKKVKVLSGGERARLLLAGLLLSKSEVLLLDEPTNHLDFETVEALGRALRGFAGTVLFISHDRTFVNLIATTILEVKSGRIKRYPGTYEDYVYHLERAARGEESEERPRAASQTVVVPKETSALKKTAAHTQPGAEKKKAKSEKSKIERQMAKLERKIEKLTRDRDAILDDMSRNPFHYSKDRDAKLKSLQVSLESAEDEWSSLQEKLDAFGS